MITLSLSIVGIALIGGVIFSLTILYLSYWKFEQIDQEFDNLLEDYDNKATKHERV